MKMYPYLNANMINGGKDTEITRGSNQMNELIIMVITVAIGLAVYGQAGPSIISPGVTAYKNTSQIDGVNSYASGTLTWSGNATDGNYVNFTYNGGNYNFCYGVNGIACASGINVPMTAGVNSSSDAANATASIINLNATLAGVLTASNQSAGVVRISYDTTGTGGNLVGTTTNATNATWSASTLTGGSSSGYSTWDTATQSTYTASGFNMALAWFLLPFLFILGVLKYF